MTFWQLSTPTSPETSDGLTNFLWEQGALGVVEEQAPGETARLRAFFAGTASSTALLRAVREYCASLRLLGLAVADGEPEIGPLHDGEWASAWQQSFPPLEIGERLLVVPPWEARADGATGGRVQVVIEPGRAFGTGHHGSTAGCLVLLEDALRSAEWPAAPAVSTLDIGTGSGILAIAAVKLGAPAVLAIDVDPDAITAAGANVEKNGCADRVRLALDGPETLVGGPAFTLILANLLGHTHLALAGIYARLARPGSALVLGGILADEAQPVIDALGAAGFELRHRVVLDGWASLRFRSSGAR